MSQSDQTPKPKPRRPSLPAPAAPARIYGRRPTYGQKQEPVQGSLTVVVTLRPDTAAAIMKLVKKHNMSRSGIGHHLMRLGAGLPPLPPFDCD